jgi:hypothetical protein
MTAESVNILLRKAMRLLPPPLGGGFSPLSAFIIMRKGKQNFCKKELSSGLLESPVRIAIQ